jgi:hypothetical protein
MTRIKLAYELDPEAIEEAKTTDLTQVCRDVLAFSVLYGMVTFIVNDVDFSEFTGILDFAARFDLIMNRLSSGEVTELRYLNVDGGSFIDFKRTAEDEVFIGCYYKMDRVPETTASLSELKVAARSFAHKVFKEFFEMYPALKENEQLEQWLEYIEFPH